jgi:hypothetical protein
MPNAKPLDQIFNNSLISVHLALRTALLRYASSFTNAHQAVKRGHVLVHILLASTIIYAATVPYKNAWAWPNTLQATGKQALINSNQSLFVFCIPSTHYCTSEAMLGSPPSATEPSTSSAKPITSTTSKTVGDAKKDAGSTLPKPKREPLPPVDMNSEEVLGGVESDEAWSSVSRVVLE